MSGRAPHAGAAWVLGCCVAMASCASTGQSESVRPARRSSPAAAPSTDRRLPVVLHFRCLESSLDLDLRDNRESLEAIVALLSSDAAVVRVRLEKHQSTTGPERGRPIALSRERARSVRAALVSHSIAPERVEAVGLGWHDNHASGADSCPPPDEDIGHPDRRVEVIVRVRAPR